MKKLLTVFLIGFSLNSYAIEKDKLVHFGTSFALTTVLYLGTNAIFNKHAAPDKRNRTMPYIWSAMAVQIAGVVWECSGTTGVDLNDMGANALGSAAAGLTIFTFDL